MPKIKISGDMLWSPHQRKKIKNLLSKGNIRYGPTLTYPQFCTPATFCLFVAIFCHTALFLFVYGSESR
ncbi:hypothetical protein Y032_0113g346 [Ancylostoma ceylanicum]|uniref:Uncharacterized protein n=1 Tax=Ancylostoma ceylanicum TaxID=53326 RepID=A0A016TDB7_9BILA|nr:hypothetical protein Y032_0113g346 [Ancylostoma ceylanicum]